MKKIFKLLSVLCMVLILSVQQAGAKPISDKIGTLTDKPQFKRIGGDSRFETAVKIARELYSGTIQNVVLATGSNFPDALSGSVLALKLNAPILLTGSDSQNANALTYIKEHLTTNGTIYILGGTGAISDKVVDSIKNIGFSNFVRLDGTDRIETNLKIVNKLNVEIGTPIIIATQNDFPDALSISSVAASKGFPILLSNINTIDQRIIKAISSIKPSTIYIVGGTGVISTKVENQLKTYSSDVIRLAGTSRYDTSLAIANHFKAASTTNALIATGTNFPDALSGSVLGGKLNSPILLVNNANILKQASFIYNNKNISNLYILGGEGVVSTSVVSNLVGEVVVVPVNPNGPTLEIAKTTSVEAPANLAAIGADPFNYKNLKVDGIMYHTQNSFIRPYDQKLQVYDDFVKCLKIDTATNGDITMHIQYYTYTNGVLDGYSEDATILLK